MTAWTEDELARIGTAEELEIASLRRDGTLGSPRTIWVVRDGDDLYVRSVNGPTAAWYRGTRERRAGHIQAGGVDQDVTFVNAGHDLDGQIDAAYRAKYGRYAAYILDAIIGPEARSTTIELVPRNVAHQLGGSLGLGVLVTVFAAAGSPTLDGSDQLARGVSAALTAGTVMLALALAVVVALIVRPHTVPASAGPQHPPEGDEVGDPAEAAVGQGTGADVHR
jgi:hypothetical protein